MLQRRLGGAPRPPERLLAAVGGIGRASEDEQEVGEAVQVHGRQRIHLRCPRRDERLAFGSPAHGPRHVQPRCRLAPPGSTKLFSSGRPALKPSQSSSSRSIWSWVTRSLPSCSTGTERSAPRSNSSFWTRRSTSPIAGGHPPASTTPIGEFSSSDGSVGRNPRVELRDPRSVAEGGLPRVASARVDLREPDGLVASARHVVPTIASRSRPAPRSPAARGSSGR